MSAANGNNAGQSNGSYKTPNQLNVWNMSHTEQVEHYIGIDVGTGSARACIMNDHGDIVGLASENIGLWQPQTGYYEQSTTNIWRCICTSIQRAMNQHNIDPATIKGIGSSIGQ